MIETVKRSSTLFYLVVALILMVSVIIRSPLLQSPSPYWEEVALGYDAFSIATTGKDHHGSAWPILAFESFGDWKPALYFYTAALSVKIFGLSVFAVRLPSALAGIGIVVATGLLAQNQSKSRLALIVGLIVSGLSSWAVHFSRAAWEVNLATCLVAWGMYFGLTIKSSEQPTQIRKWYPLWSTLCLLLSMYAYHGTRVVAPLLGATILWYWYSQGALQQLLRSQQKVLGVILISIALASIPFLSSLSSQTLNQRFNETSIFGDLSIIQASNKLKEDNGNTLLAKLFFHRYVLFSQQILQNYLDHFSLGFLFLRGDDNPRHSTQLFGHLYYFELLFLLTGIHHIIQKKDSKGVIIILWWLVAIVPISLTKATPHALRMLPAAPAIFLIITDGIMVCHHWLMAVIKKMIHHNAQSKIHHMLVNFQWIFILAIGGLYGIFFTLWQHDYQTVYQKKYASFWQFGYEEVINNIAELQRQQPQLATFITREQGRPAMYYWFFSQTPPQRVQASQLTAKKDQSEFLEFELTSFPQSTDEIITTSIGASSPGQRQKLESRGFTITNKSEIKSPTADVVWETYLAIK